MAIDKAGFDAIKTSDIKLSFDDLDANNDGVINEEDISCFGNDNVSASQVYMLISLASSSADSENTDDGLSDLDYSELQTKLSNIDSEIKALNTQLEGYTSTLDGLSSELSAAKSDESQKKQDLTSAQSKLKEEQEKLEKYSEEYSKVQSEIEAVNNQILAEQEQGENDYSQTITEVVSQAINDYDPETDGDDFEAYIDKAVSDAGYPVFANLDALNSKADGLSSEAKNLLGNIKLQSIAVSSAQQSVVSAQKAYDKAADKTNSLSNEVDAVNLKIASLNTQIAAKETERTSVQSEMASRVDGGGLSAAEVLAQISDEEKQLLKDNNIDLTDCRVAKGEDGQFHVYFKDSAVSVARKYGENKGYDIIPKGSGYIRDVKCGGDKAVYTFSEVNDCLTDGTCCSSACCYSTTSPLAFDVNGDGVKTTSQTVEFDIDGDGQKDIVNNSADWVLAFDKDHDGISGEDGSELFGDNTDLDGDGVKDGYSDGFAALKALAQQEGLVSSGDNILNAEDIAVLSDKYGLVMTNGYGGESVSLKDLGITEISLADTTSTTLIKNFDGLNNDLMTQEGATFIVNGEEREYADIWNSKKADNSSQNAGQKISKKASVFSFDVDTNKTIYEKLNSTVNNDSISVFEGNIDYESIRDEMLEKAEATQEYKDKLKEQE